MSNVTQKMFSSLRWAIFTPLSIFAFWAFPNFSFATTGDSTKYLMSKDTLFITLDEKTGEKIFEHRIVKSQTLYSLARFYGMNEEQLFPYNPTLKSNKVGIGQVVRVPIGSSPLRIRTESEEFLCGPTPTRSVRFP